LLIGEVSILDPHVVSLDTHNRIECNWVKFKLNEIEWKDVLSTKYRFKGKYLYIHGTEIYIV